MARVVREAVYLERSFKRADSYHAKESPSSNGSPRTPLSQWTQCNKSRSRRSSVERSYEDSFEMDSSCTGSPSPHSVLSGSKESMIDLDMHNLVSRHMKEMEALKEHNNVLVPDKNSNKTSKSRPSNVKSSSWKKPNKPPLLVLPEWNTSTKSRPKKSVTPEKSVQKEKKPSNSVKNTKKGAKSPTVMKDSSEARLDKPDIAHFMLKHARELISSGENPEKALHYAIRASKSFEQCAGGKPSLDLVMCLHVVAVILTNLGQYEEAIPVLEKSIKFSVPEEGHEHYLAKFTGYMQLGDTYAMLGQLENSIQCYTSGLQVQKDALGDRDPSVGETCRYLAEAYMQAMQLDEAESLCKMALKIHREQCSPGSPEEMADRRLLGLICDTKGDYESALDHLVSASMSMMSSGQEEDVPSVDCSIGDTYLTLGRYDEAVFAYHKALSMFKSTKGENDPSVASVFVRIADLYNRKGKFKESKFYCEHALRIYGKPPAGTCPEEIARGLTDISAIYESMEEPEQALKFLHKALKIYNDEPGKQITVAVIEAQMGVLYYTIGNYAESYSSFKNSITKLRTSGEKKSAFFGILLNQMGLACSHLSSIDEAAELFKEARSVLEEECGPYHRDTLGACSNLAGAYEAMGRFNQAIEILERIVGLREEMLGTANPAVDDEKRRLSVLLKEAGRIRHRKTTSLEMLLDGDTHFV